MAQSIRVLIVESNPQYADMLAGVLADSRDNEFDVDRATTLAEALDTVSSATFDAVLLNISALPDAAPDNALDVYSQVAASTGQTPIIVITDSNNDAFAVELIDRGAQAYIVKDSLNSAMIAPLVASAVDGCHLLAEVNAQAKKLSESECRKRLPVQWDKVAQSIFSVNMIGSSLPHLWRRNPHEAQQGLTMLHSVAQETLCKINGLLDEGRVTCS